MSKQFEEVQNMASRSQSSEDSESEDVSSSENEYIEKLNKCARKIAKEGKRLKEEESKIYDMFIQFCIQNIIEKIEALMTCENCNSTNYFTISHNDIKEIIIKFYDYTPYCDYLKKVCDKYKFRGVCSWHHISSHFEKYKGKSFNIKLKKIEDITDDVLRLEKSKELYDKATRRLYNAIIESIWNVLYASEFKSAISCDDYYYDDYNVMIIDLGKLYK